MITGLTDKTSTANGVTFSVSNNVVTVNGTSSGGSYWYTDFIKSINIEAGKLYVFGLIDEDGNAVDLKNISFYTMLWDNNTSQDYYNFGYSEFSLIGIIPNNDMTLGSVDFYINDGKTINNLTFKTILYEV